MDDEEEEIPAPGGAARRDLLARTYLSGEAVLESGVALARAAWDGLWLGLLDEVALARVDEHYYSGQPVYLSDQHNRRGLFDWEVELVDQLLKPGGAVAVTGAGGGREVLALLQLGYDAVGFEPHPVLAASGAAMLARLGHPGRLHHVPVRGWPAGAADERRWDAVLVGWGAYMLIPSRRSRVELLRAASAATSGRGAVAISYFAMPTDAAQVRPFRLSRRVARALRRLRRVEPPLLGDALVPNFAHFFTSSQVVDELVAASLECAASGRSGDYGWSIGRSAGGLSAAAGEEQP